MKMINKEPQLTEPKVFALLIEFGDTNFISVQSAFSLEEAFILAKLEFESIQEQMLEQRRIAPKTGVAKISLFASKTVYELNNPPEVNLTAEEGERIKRTVDTIKKIDEKEKKEKENNKETIEKKNYREKNELMAKIIDSKNKDMLEENKHLLTESEIKFIENSLK